MTTVEYAIYSKAPISQIGMVADKANCPVDQRLVTPAEHAAIALKSSLEKKN